MVNDAPTNKNAEDFVRRVVVGVAKDCPIEVLTKIGQCIIDCRLYEFEDEAKLNGLGS